MINDDFPVTYSHDDEIPGIIMALNFKQFLEMNIPLESLLRNTSLNKQWYNDLNATISVRNCMTIISNALAESGDESLGLALGEYTRLCEFGIWGYAIISSKTIGEAVDMGLRFWKLIGFGSYIFRREDESYEIWEIRPVFEVKEKNNWKFLVDFCLAFVQASVYFLANITNLYHKIILSYPKPSNHSQYHGMFNCPIYFDNDIDTVYVPKSHLEMPTSMGHPQVLQVCIKQCEELLLSLDKKDTLIESIRNNIVLSSFKLFRLDQISEKLGISARTLQRELSRRNTTFQKILSETRREIAKAFLTDTDLTIDQISSRLGFSESVSFRKAFKKWTGLPPKEFRR